MEAVAQTAVWLGDSATEHLKTYVHATLVDRSEIDEQAALERPGDRVDSGGSGRLPSGPLRGRRRART